MEELTSKNQNCKNCEYPISDDHKFCFNCGQKNTDGRISIRSFFDVFFSTVFNLESKFFQTMAHIFIPGKLTAEYFKGKHKRYFHPVRLFIISALFLIAAISFQINANAMNFGLEENAKNQIQKEYFLAEVDSLSQLTVDKFQDSLSLKPAFDTLYHYLNRKHSTIKDSIDMNKNVIIGGLDNFELMVSNKDFINLSAEELINKYKIESTLNRFIFKQKIKLYKDKGTFAPFLLGNSLWIILLMMPFLALILKLLYLRKDHYYVEHLVFSFHVHSFAFLLFTLIALSLFIKLPTWLIAIGLGILLIYLFLALRKVYKQVWYVTILKFLLINITYFFLFLFFFIFCIIMSMAIF